MKCPVSAREVPDVVCAARQLVLEARRLRAAAEASGRPVPCDGCAAGRGVLYEFLSGAGTPAGEHEVTVDFSDHPELLERFRGFAKAAGEAVDAHLKWLVGVYVSH